MDTDRDSVLSIVTELIAALHNVGISREKAVNIVGRLTVGELLSVYEADNRDATNLALDLVSGETVRLDSDGHISALVLTDNNIRVLQLFHLLPLLKTAIIPDSPLRKDHIRLALNAPNIEEIYLYDKEESHVVQLSELYSNTYRVDDYLMVLTLK